MSILSSDVKITNGGGLGPSPGTPVPLASHPSMPVLPRRHIDPHSIAHARLSKAARAVLGAEILDGNVALSNPTIEMVVRGIGVSAGYIGKARKLSPEARRDVLREKRPLVQAKAPTAPVPSAERRLNMIVAEIGISATLDMLERIEHKAM
jgi:hypothetical protein